MSFRKVGAAIGVATALTASCSSENSPNPATESSSSRETGIETISPPTTEQFVPTPWPELQACKEDGVYTILEDSTPAIRCAIGNTLKQQIDDDKKVTVFKGTITVGNIALDDACLFQPLVMTVKENETPFTYLGVTRVGPGKTGAEIFTFPFKSQTPITSEHTHTTTVDPTPEGVYIMEYNRESYAVGLLAMKQNCEDSNKY